MKKLSRRIVVALALVAVLVFSVAGGVMAAGPHDGDCPNDGVCPNDCPYDGDGPADGTGMQYRGQANADDDVAATADGTGSQNRAQANTASRTQYNSQANAVGNCNANQYCHGYGQAAE